MNDKQNTLKTLLRFYRPYKGLFFADLGCSLVAAAIGLILPLGAGYITDNVLTASPTPWQILRVGLLLVLLVAIQAGCNYFMDY